MKCTRDGRSAVELAHEFVRSYADATGCIPQEATFRMGHMLAHWRFR